MKMFCVKVVGSEPNRPSRSVFINPTKVRDVQPAAGTSKVQAVLTMTDGHSYYIEEYPKQVVELWENAINHDSYNDSTDTTS